MKIGASDLVKAESYTLTSKARLEELSSVLDNIKLDGVELSKGYLLDSAKATVHSIIDNTLVDLCNRLSQTKHILAHLSVETEAIFSALDSDYEFDLESMDDTSEMIDDLGIRDDLEAAGYSLDIVDMADKQLDEAMMARQVQYMLYTDAFDSEILKYDAQIEVLYDQILWYQNIVDTSNGKVIPGVNNADVMLSMNDSESIQAARRQLAILQPQYSELSQTMLILRGMRDYSCNMQYKMYTIYDDFNEKSSVESRIASHDTIFLDSDDNHRQFGNYIYYDVNGNIISDVTEEELALYINDNNINANNLFMNTKYNDYISYLNEEEIKIAKYLLNTGNHEGLEEYLHLVHNTANDRRGQELANEIMAQLKGY